jgi:hypothetical protein
MLDFGNSAAGIESDGQTTDPFDFRRPGSAPRRIS